MKFGFSLLAALAVMIFAAPVFAGGSCGYSCDYSNKDKSKYTKPTPAAAPAASAKDIVDIAAGGEIFNTLVAAVKAADLVEALKSDGPFTVLAPTDKAFSKLPKGTIEHLLKPENKGELVKILTYHVVPGKVSDLEALIAKKAKTLQGGKVYFKLKDDQMMVNNAKIAKTNIDASNGMIHVIDTVILPTNDASAKAEYKKDHKKH